MPDLPSNWNAGDDQFDNSYNWQRLLATTGTGAAAGTSVNAGWGTLVGAGVGLAGGLLANENSGPSKKDIYDSLMRQYYSSPEYTAAQTALGKIKDETVQGPTAQERNDLGLALQAANQHAASTYGNIQSQLASTQGVGASTQAALTASQGQGAATQMSQAAMQAAAAESARRQQATSAYAAATLQAQQMQDGYRRWASGQANDQNDKTTAANFATVNAGLSAVGSTAGGLKNAYDEQHPTALAGGPGTAQDFASGVKSLSNGFTGPGPFPGAAPPSTAPGASPLKDFMGASQLQGSAQQALSSQAPQYTPQFSDGGPLTAAESAQQTNRRTTMPNYGSF